MAKVILIQNGAVNQRTFCTRCLHSQVGHTTHGQSYKGNKLGIMQNGPSAKTYKKYERYKHLTNEKHITYKNKKYIII